MDKRLEDIFIYNRNAIMAFSCGVECLKNQNYRITLANIAVGMDWLIKSAEIILKMKEYFENGRIFDEISFHEIITCQIKAQETKNYILLMDCFEKRLLPLLYGIQEYIIINETEPNNREEFNIMKLKERDINLYNFFSASSDDTEKTKGKYIGEFSAEGTVTAKYIIDKQTKYLHSNISPVLESYQLVNDWYDVNKSKYIIYGLGMGYHIGNLRNIDKGIEIDVYESNSDIFNFVKDYNGNDVLINVSDVCIHYDPDLTKLESRLETMSEETKFVIFYPSLYYIKENSQKLENLIDKYGMK